MNKLEDNLREVMKAQCCNIWTLIITTISMAARDHHGDFHLRRDSIIGSLYDLSTCRNNKCHSIRANMHDHVMGLDLDETHVETNPVHVTAASPDLQCEKHSEKTPQPGSELSPEMALENIQKKQNSNTINPCITKILTMMDFLEDLDMSDEESLVSILKNLGSVGVTYEVLNETYIGRLVNKLTKHGSSDVQRLAKQRIKEWKELVVEWKKSKACSSSSQAIKNEASPIMINGPGQIEKKAKPVKIRVVSSKKNGSDFRERETKPAPTRPDSINGSDYLDRKVKPDPIRGKTEPFKEAPARVNNHPASFSPPKKNERDELYDSARFDSARKRLQQNYQEDIKAKKQKRIQVMEIDEIPKPKNEFIRKSVSTSKNRLYRHFPFKKVCV